MFNVPIGGKIPDLDQVFTVEHGLQLSKELAASAVRYTGEQVLMFVTVEQERQTQTHGGPKFQTWIKSGPNIDLY